MNYKRHHTVHKEDNIQRYQSFSKTSSNLSGNPFNNSSYKSNSIHRAMNKSHSKKSNHSIVSNHNLVNVTKLKNISSSDHQEAQRIQLLSDIDKDYYKMLKSTIQMEK